MKRGSAANRLADFYLGIPVLNLVATFRRKRSYPENPKRIGLFFNPALGDTLLASAAVQDIRGIFPDAALIVFAAKPNLAAARLLPSIDQIKLLPITNPVKAIRTLRSCELDLMLDFSAWQRTTAFYTFLSGARFRVGFKRQGQYRHRGYDLTACHSADCHEIENLRRLTRLLGAQHHCEPNLILPDEPDAGDRIPSGRFIVFHPWASGFRSWQREWPAERWVELAKCLSVPERSVLVTGAPADEDRAQLLCLRLRSQGVPAGPFIGRGGLGEVARLLKHAQMLISVNTGIMHLGAILGVPTISLNGPTAAHRWGPRGPRVANVCPSDGSGGFLDLGFEYRGHPGGVMEKISVDDVLKAVRRLEEQAEPEVE